MRKGVAKRNLGGKRMVQLNVLISEEAKKKLLFQSQTMSYGEAIEDLIDRGYRSLRATLAKGLPQTRVIPGDSRSTLVLEKKSLE